MSDEEDSGVLPKRIDVLKLVNQQDDDDDEPPSPRRRIPPPPIFPWLTFWRYHFPAYIQNLPDSPKQT